MPVARATRWSSADFNGVSHGKDAGLFVGPRSILDIRILSQFGLFHVEDWFSMALAR